MIVNHHARSPTDVACQDCNLSEVCLPRAFKPSDQGILARIVRNRRPLTRGDHLFLEGDPFCSVFVVRSGALKVYSTSHEGEVQISGFYLSSEWVGLNGLAHNHYPVSAQALETTAVCEIPFDEFDHLCAQYPSLRRQLMQAMGLRICEHQRMSLLLSKKTAEQRFATLLLDLSARLGSRGFSPKHFRLPMSRNELGNYLGLALETVSRILSRLQSVGLIIVNGRDVQILSLHGLHQIARTTGPVKMQ